MYFLVSWCSLTFLTGSWGWLHKVNSSTAAALGAAHMNHHLVPLSDGMMISVLTNPEKITSQGCLSNPAGSALQLLQPTAGNQSETQPVDLGLMGSCGIALGHTSTGASQGITTVAADKEWSLFAHRLLNSPYSQALRNPPLHKHLACQVQTLECDLILQMFFFLVSEKFVESFIKSPLAT